MKDALLKNIKLKLNQIPIYELNLIQTTMNLNLTHHNKDYINKQLEIIKNLNIDIDVKNFCLLLLKEMGDNYEKRN